MTFLLWSFGVLVIGLLLLIVWSLLVMSSRNEEDMLKLEDEINKYNQKTNK